MFSPLTIDFEASCLPCHGRSFPIEVGIADGSGWSRAWLIQPEPAWKDWTWTEEAQSLHGISQPQLLRAGLAAAQVMRELNAIASGRAVIADHDLDRRWLSILAEAATVAPLFHIDHVATLLDRHAPCEESVRQASSAADRVISDRHRAGPDALWLAIFLANLPTAESPLFAWTEGGTRQQSLAQGL